MVFSVITWTTLREVRPAVGPFGINTLLMAILTGGKGNGLSGQGREDMGALAAA